MKWLPLLFILLSVNTLLGQFDSLYPLPFNQRFAAIRDTLMPYSFQRDSIVFQHKMEKLAQLAKNKKDKTFSLEADLLLLHQNSGKPYLDQEVIEKEYEKIINKAAQGKDKRILALAYYYAGSYFWDRKRDFSQSIQYYEKAYTVIKAMADTDFFYKQQIIYKVGEKYFYLSDYSNAIRFLSEAAEIENPWKPLHPNISVFNTKGLAHRSIGQLDSAEYCFKKALEFAKKANAKVWIGNLSGNLGAIYIQKGDLEKGLQMLRTDLNISLQRKSKNSASGALLEMARVKLLQGDLNKSVELLDSSLLLGKNRIPYPRKKVLYQLLSDIYKKQGDYETALIYLDSTLIVRDSLAKQDRNLQTLRLRQRIELEESRAAINQTEAENKRKTILLYSVMGGLILALGGGFLLFRQKRKTEAARERSDQLLLNILPANVASELKTTGSAKARKFQEVTVLFSDFKNFTTFSEDLAPEQLVLILDDYFRKFDQVMEECGLEKIKTIGDAYMCVCGLPKPDPLHAKKVVEAAIKMQKIVQENPNGWQLRIGIHSGPVVAGIVGSKKFAYDIWGDTVNVAARMEQKSEPGKINVSKNTHLLVRDHFSSTFRGRISAKNKSAMEMYFIESKKHA